MAFARKADLGLSLQANFQLTRRKTDSGINVSVHNYDGVDAAPHFVTSIPTVVEPALSART